MSAHPSPEALAAFGLGRLADDTIAQHLDTCADCRRVVADASADPFLKQVRSVAHPLPTGTYKPVAQTTPPAGRPGPAGGAGVPPSFPGYEVVRELGRGGMGVVYLARNTLMARDEVLKVVSRALLDKPGAADRFLREIQAAAKLQHPNVVAAYAALQTGDTLAFAMEYVPGEDLAAVVKARGPLPVPNACYYAYHATQGLQHAHERGMVHRDIKPSNLILAKADGKTVVKVLDFGLAKATREKPGAELTGEGRMLGTPAYIAPEQAQDATNADIRADIYSLGCTLFHLLAGRPPFASENWLDLLVMHQSAPVPSVADSRPGVPPGLADVVANMMAKQPAARFRTPAEVGHALRPFFQKGGKGGGLVTMSRVGVRVPFLPQTPPPPAPPPEPPAAVLQSDLLPPPRRRPWRIPAAVAGVIAAVFLVAWAGGLLRVKTENGTIVLAELPADTVVEVNGQVVTVSWDGGRKEARITAKPGDTIEVKQGDLKVGGRTVTVEDAKAGRLVVELAPPAGPKPGADGFVPLFDGKSLAEWRVNNHNKGTWAVVDGVLVGRGGPVGQKVRSFALLETTRVDFADFHLRMTYRLPTINVNYIALRSGEAVYAPPRLGSNFTAGALVCLGHPSATAPPAGSAEIPTAENLQNKDNIWIPNAGANKFALPPTTDWVALEVEAVGGRVRTWVNGNLVRDLTDVPAKPGRIGLFCLDGGLLEVKSVEVADLTGAKLNLAPEGSVWSASGVYTDANGSRPAGGSWRVAERRGRSLTFLNHGGTGIKNYLYGRIGDDGRITITEMQRIAPDPKEREAIQGTGEVGSERMNLHMDYTPYGSSSRLELKRLPDGGESFNFQGRWQCFHQPSGWKGDRTVTGGTLLTHFNGEVSSWERDGGLIRVHYANDGLEWLVIDPDRPDELHGGGGGQAVTYRRP